MVSRIITVDAFDMVVFGATGDLAARKLFPALYHRDHMGQLPDQARVIGVSRRHMPEGEFRSLVEAALDKFVDAAERDAGSRSRFLDRVSYVAADASSDDGWSELAEALHDRQRVCVLYLAVGPDLVAPLCDRLGRFGLNGPNARLVVEKPLGKTGDGARQVNDAIGQVFEERQVFRIDHYLGKETVQNLMALRFANKLFEPLWNAAHVNHVQITVAETLGVGGRAGYYNTAGALRDMVQNHILQLLCLVAMEPPRSIDAEAVRDEKLKVLRSLRPISDHNAHLVTVRGQYRGGAAEGAVVPGFLDELGDPTSATETFVAVKAEIDNWRWAGVPFYLRTGKRMPQRVSEIVVTFQPVPYNLFGPTVGPVAANRLVVRLQPDDGVKLWLMIKDPGPGGMRLTYVPLDMTFAEAFGVRSVDAYERLLMDVVRGNQTLFMRRDEVEAAWAWIDPILAAWQASAEAPKPYNAGSWGPSAAIALIERDGRTWHDDVL